MLNETIITRLAVAFLLGAIIGLEREYRDKSAGFRTMALISLGSCLFTVVSIIFGTDSHDRIASNIVTGIGFIGAGVIFKNETGVDGLTTAASIWATAAVGMATGSGYYIPAAVTTLLILLVLMLLNKVESLIDKINRERTYRIITKYHPDIAIQYESLIKRSGLKYKEQKRTRTGDEIEFTWKMAGSIHKHDEFVQTVMNDKTVSVFEFLK